MDSGLKKIQILDPVTGTCDNYYGQSGSDLGQLNLPQDIAIDSSGNVAVANNGNNRVEVIYTVTGP